MNARAWVKKAILPKGNKSKQRSRSLEKKGLLDICQGDGILVGSDNHRAHFWFDDEIEAEYGEIEYPINKVLDMNERGRKGIELCELSTYAVKKACTIAMALFKKRYSGDFIAEGMVFIYVHVDEDRLMVGSNREEVGAMTFTLRDGDVFPLQTKVHDLSYTFSEGADPDHFYINPKYFKQALEGMGKSAVLRKNGGMLHFTGENGAEAVVMALRFDDFTELHTPHTLGDQDEG